MKSKSFLLKNDEVERYFTFQWNILSYYLTDLALHHFQTIIIYFLRIVFAYYAIRFAKQQLT